jgi:hypothetical protein|uniref:Uncharacterized protein n=1 Tax=Siphoviridae sp. ctyg07 TaxID=2825747 RepID=A0A8S5VCJ1_9CAUD|nr:MAG TPA: hypothetical protein [Siphoviridae sp. ctyg07]
MSDDTSNLAVDTFKAKLRSLKETWLGLQDCESLELGDPFIDDAWNAYLSARIDAENAITDLVQELNGFYVLAQISNVHVNGVE